MKNRKSSRGFTLVELAVAVAVAGIGLSATAAAVTSGARLARTTAETRSASRSAQCLFERMRATPFADVLSTFHGRTFAMSTLGGGDSSGVASVTVTSVDSGSARWKVLRVRILTSWSGSVGATPHRLVTFICDRTDSSSLSTERSTIPADAEEAE